MQETCRLRREVLARFGAEGEPPAPLIPSRSRRLERRMSCPKRPLSSVFDPTAMSTFDALFADESLARMTVDASPAGMIITDAEGRIVLVNPRAESLFGYESGELIGKEIETLVPVARREAHRAHREQYLTQAQPRPMAAGRDLYGLRKDHTQFPVDISLHPIETRLGRLVLANILDATDRRRAEREREARQRMERLAMLGQLAGGVAHEIRTPLCVISNDIFFLRQFADQLGPEGVECVEEIEQAVRKANRIVTELLEFTRDAPLETVETAVTEILELAVRNSGLPEAITVQLPQLSADDTIDVDPEQIERLIANLLRNASQAMASAGDIEVRVESEADRVVIEVADRGEGISPENLQRVFEPLFTTRPSGIGLGLAVSRRYAERHGGRLVALPREDGGTCVRLELPRRGQ